MLILKSTPASKGAFFCYFTSLIFLTSPLSLLVLQLSSCERSEKVILETSALYVTFSQELMKKKSHI